MKATFVSVLALAAVLVVGPADASADQVGTAFSYQGRLTDSGVPVNGGANMLFTLYDAAVGPGVIGQLGPVSVFFDEGLFTQQLDFGVDPWAANESRWLEIAVEFPPGSGFVTLDPRQELTPTPFSLATRGINVDAVGQVGIGTASPGHRLHVVSSAITALGGETHSISTQAAGVVGVVASTSPGAYSAGLRGINNGTGGLGIGVWGSQDGSGWGVYGTSSAGRGVYGSSDGTTGPSFGVYGESASCLEPIPKPL